MPGKILIVDDEKDMLALLRRMISEERDYEVITENDPQRALERFRAQPVELVMTDLKMPGMDGIGLLEAVKKLQPKTAVIVLTAFATIETAVEATQKGAFDYITKPFRQERILLTVNCTAIPQEVLESELFGHVKGAFTGAWKEKKGLVEEAHEGSLFLDEIGDLSPHLQTKLLRLLQEGEYKPVGSLVTKKADLRIIAATNHDLKTGIREKRFREDLYYRLNVIQFELPPLRERKEDIALLSRHFLAKYATVNRKSVTDISP
jgi:DNA-binding NtrC family response regulator